MPEAYLDQGVDFNINQLRINISNRVQYNNKAFVWLLVRNVKCGCEIFKVTKTEACMLG